MKLRTYLARNAGRIHSTLHHAIVKDHAYLPNHIIRMALSLLDAAALHMSRLSPKNQKHPSALEHRADLDCLHTLDLLACALECTELYDELKQYLKD